MNSETILILEDDLTMQRVLRDNFEFAGYAVLTANDGEQGLQLARDTNPDLVLLDIMLPEINGYEVCRLLRTDGLDMPIIMLTAKGQESDIVLGLNLGADDYVTKPFSTKELLARVEATLRRQRQKASKIQRFGDLELHCESRKLLRGSEEIALTPKEFELLKYFLTRAGRALSRDEILRKVWSDDPYVTLRSVDRFVTTLRNKIEPNPRRSKFIKTVRSIGYRFEFDSEDANGYRV